MQVRSVVFWMVAMCAGTGDQLKDLGETPDTLHTLFFRLPSAMSYELP